LAGFIYIMSNPAFPDLLKIGKSKKDPTQDRVSELNQTGVPEPFRVEYYAFVENEDALETLAHIYFSAKRPNKKREFFSIDCAVAINTIRDLAIRHSLIKFEEVFYVSPEELQAQRLDQEAKELAKAEAKTVSKKKAKRWVLFLWAGAAISMLCFWFFKGHDYAELTIIVAVMGIFALILLMLWEIYHLLRTNYLRAKALYEKAIQTLRRIVTKKQ
jgi:hypothetical protein